MPYAKTIDQVQNLLNVTFDELDSLFDKPEMRRNYRPKDAGWTIDELLEHVTLTSHFLLIVIRNGHRKCLKRAANQALLEGESDLEIMAPIGHPDAFPWLRPEHMEPTRAKPGSEVRLLMRRQQAECLEILVGLNNGEGALHKVRMSVQNLGKLDMYQWLYFLALHAQRHLAQIERVWAEQQDA
jgi:hypothetical protein